MSMSPFQAFAMNALTAPPFLQAFAMDAFKQVYEAQQGTIKALATDQPSENGTRHHYRVAYQPSAGGPEIDLGIIKFQNGDAARVGVNGVSDQALLSIVADHIEGFNRGPYACEANRQASYHIREAIRWLKQRPVLSPPQQGAVPNE